MTAAALTALWVAFVGAAIVAHRPATTRMPVSRRSPAERRAPNTSHRPGRLVAGSRRAATRRRVAMIATGLPDVVDLVAISVAAGLNVRLSLEAVVRRAPPGPLVDEFARALDDVRAGARLADAVEAVSSRAGDVVRPLVAALVDSERYGGALGPALVRAADEARRTRQRRAEEAARRVPVKLLFPLVTCVLPAFALLTVAPLVAGGLDALRP